MKLREKISYERQKDKENKIEEKENNGMILEKIHDLKGKVENLITQKKFQNKEKNRQKSSKGKLSKPTFLFYNEKNKLF